MDRQRPRLDDILSGGGNFDDLWNSTSAADEFQPIPPGVYRCLVADGKLAEAKTGTAGYKLTFEVLDGPHAGRKVFHDLWLTAKAMPTTKRDAAKLGIHSFAQMRQALPAGLVVEAKVALRTEDDGRQFNRVLAFRIVGDVPADDLLAPDQDDLDEAVTPDTHDVGGFDWGKGEQKEKDGPPADPVDPADPDDHPRGRKPRR